MSDGTMLAAEVSVPADPVTGIPAKGPFPVILQATPYAKDGPTTEGSSYPHRYEFVPRGYLHVLVDVRGTGASGGSFRALGPREIRDYVELIDWAAELPASSGRIGMTGISYLGINALAAAGAIERGSPLKAIVPMMVPTDFYRDLLVPGGLYNALFGLPYAAVAEAGLITAGPLLSPDEPPDTAEKQVAHLHGVMDIDVRTILDAVVGGERAYNTRFWRKRRPARWIARIPENGVKTLVLGGWFDIYPRASGLVFSQLQNAAAERRVSAPMRAGQETDGRYQMVIGPFTHAWLGDAQWELTLQWFDTWLKRERTGVQDTNTPLHAYEVKGGRWVDLPRWPPPKSVVERWYFGPGPSSSDARPNASGAHSINDGTLRPVRPVGEARIDQMFWNGPLNSYCNRTTDQMFINGPMKGFQDRYGYSQENPCTYEGRSFEWGALSYTTEPMKSDVTIAGPGYVRIYAESNRPQTEWVAQLTDISPDGASRPLSIGSLLGSLRELKESASWRLGGQMIAPSHPFSRTSEEPVPIGEITRYDIELPGILARIKRGHRIRLTVQSAAVPYLVPKGSDVPGLMGGIYQVQRSAGASSFLQLPLIDPDGLRKSAIQWAPCVTDC